MYDWYDFAIDIRAHKGRETGVDGKQYKGGEFESAIKLMFSFPKTYAYGDGKTHKQSL